ncbi:MAG: phosphate propanoyltransferase [Oscillospiraceae bacterium]|jgi:putative phosphotransacetylase|nr:phosphate propanoyltransferase [Oscillospiraceae bacterium]
MKILVEVSARHIHLSEADFKKLFGSDASLGVKRNLSQKGQFLSDKKIDLIGTKSVIKDVSILGPFRKDTQIEISLTDSFKLGVKVPVRESGFLDDTPGCKITGPCGQIEIKKGLIIPKRHVHLSPESARNNNFKNSQNLLVRINSKERSLIFLDAVVRIEEYFTDAVHIDTDEANAAGIESNTLCEISGTEWI